MKNIIIASCATIIILIGFISLAIKSYNDTEKYKEQTIKNAERNYEIATKARQEDLKYGDDMYDKYTKDIWNGKRPVVEVPSSTPEIEK